MNAITETVRILWKLAKELHQEGISYQQYLTELTWLLLLRIAPRLLVSIPPYLTFEAIQYKKAAERYESYQTLLTALGQVSDPYIAGIYAQARTSLKNHQQLEKFIIVLEEIAANQRLFSILELGAVYESLIEQCVRNDQSSSYLIPPRSLVDVMVTLLQPEPNEIIYDPLAGIASFLIAADQYAKTISDEFAQSQYHVCYGIEPDLSQQRLALMNCLLHGLTSPYSVPVQWQKSLLMNTLEAPENFEKADVILSMLLSNRLVEETKRYDVSLMLLQHISKMLKPGGRAAVILPDTMLQLEGFTQQTRREFFDYCNVHSLLRLPQGTFYPAFVPACLLFFKRGKNHLLGNTKETWICDLRTPFSTLTAPITYEHFIPFTAAYSNTLFERAPRLDETTKKYWHVLSRADLAERGNRLDLSWLDEQKVAVKNARPDTIWSVLDSTMAELEMLKNLLKSSSS